MNQPVTFRIYGVGQSALPTRNFSNRSASFLHVCPPGGSLLASSRLPSPSPRIIAVTSSDPLLPLPLPSSPFHTAVGEATSCSLLSMSQPFSYQMQHKSKAMLFTMAAKTQQTQLPPSSQASSPATLPWSVDLLTGSSAVPRTLQD